MKQDWRSAIALPVSVRAGLERYCHQLRDALGEQLVAVILYGGLAKGEYTPQHSNVNVMVVLQDVTTEVLDNMVAPVQQGMRDLRLAVMVLSANNLHRSAHVFPSKFLDMQQHHHVLWGKAVLTALPISQEHLRLRCEQEIKNLLLRLRQSYLQHVHRSELLEGTLVRAMSSFLSSLWAVLMLQAGHAPTGKGAIAAAAGRELGLDDKPLQDVLPLKSGQYTPDATALKRLYNAFMGTVQHAADMVDRL